jgi:hypothetical protein
MKAYKRSGYTASLFLTSAPGGGSGQLHAPSALLLGRDPPVPIKQKAGWAPEPLWTFQKIEKCLATDRPVRSPLTIPVTLSRVPVCSAKGKNCNDMFIVLPKRRTLLLQTKCISVWNARANAPNWRPKSCYKYDCYFGQCLLLVSCKHNVSYSEDNHDNMSG